MSKNDGTPIEKLFGSKTRAKLLQLFFANPEKSYYVREITRVIEEQINSVRRELMNLEGIGIVKNDTYDNKVYYSANSKHPFARPLTLLFTTKLPTQINVEVKGTGWVEYIRPVKNYLKFLLVTNRLPGQDGIDMLIVGDDKTKKLTHWAEIVEKKQGKPLNYVILSRDDFIYRLSVKDRFLSEVMEMEISEKYDPDEILKEVRAARTMS
ncbi:MAG: transcriptional regulator [Candidatus Saccharibacteria bacterium]|nr:transcriptional regulator [Candidatus Saccharibacteria bacterium]